VARRLQCLRSAPGRAQTARAARLSWPGGARKGAPPLFRAPPALGAPLGSSCPRRGTKSREGWSRWPDRLRAGPAVGAAPCGRQSNRYQRQCWSGSRRSRGRSCRYRRGALRPGTGRRTEKAPWAPSGGRHSTRHGRARPDRRRSGAGQQRHGSCYSCRGPEQRPSRYTPSRARTADKPDMRGRRGLTRPRLAIKASARRTVAHAAAGTGPLRPGARARRATVRSDMSAKCMQSNHACAAFLLTSALTMIDCMQSGDGGCSRPSATYQHSPRGSRPRTRYNAVPCLRTYPYIKVDHRALLISCLEA
jgi:hypothetical protein